MIYDLFVFVLLIHILPYLYKTNHQHYGKTTGKVNPLLLHWELATGLSHYGSLTSQVGGIALQNGGLT